MQRCPKCGTVLDESKKTCYMCGTDLTELNQDGGFGDSLSKEIQDVVSSPEVLFADDLQDVNPEQTTNSFDSVMGSLNSLDKGNNSSVSKKTTPPPKEKKNPPKKEKPKKEVKKEEKKKVTPPEEQSRFLDFNQENQNQNSVETPKKKTNFALIFNITCIILFIGAGVFVYFKFFRNKTDGFENLGGLKYTISKDFKLTSSSDDTKHYNYGDGCSIKVSYGKASGKGFVDTYLDSKKESFQEEKNMETIRETIKINDNTWESLSVVYISKDEADKKVVSYEKYKYISVFKDGEYYHTIYVNANNDNKCSAMYKEFIDSLQLK